LPAVILLSCLTLSIVALCVLVALFGTLFAFLLPRNQPVSSLPVSTPVPTLPPLKVYKVVGKPTMNAQFINDVLDYYNSPASGKGLALYNYGVKYGIDPAYAMAFFLEESNFGTKGVAVTTHALGNIRARAGEPQYKGYRSYHTWEQGFEDWYRLIATKYVQEWRLTTVDRIVPVYAPAEDNNDQEQYIRTVKIAIERWRNGHIDI
jgi:Mannosyl-glycoprotein endo-beta-N-acetylglucosaminidase